MEKRTLKDCAKQAKERLSGGYWETVRKDKENFLEEHKQYGEDNITNLENMYQKRIQKEIFSLTTLNDKDEALYRKVSKLLSENSCVLNPIMQLIDHEEFDKLSEKAKQNYIFELTDKYNEMKHRFEKEQKERLVFGR